METRHLLVAGFALGALVFLTAAGLLVLLPRRSPEFVVTALAAAVAAVFLVLDGVALRLQERRRTPGGSPEAEGPPGPG